MSLFPAVDYKKILREPMAGLGNITEDYDLYLTIVFSLQFDSDNIHKLKHIYILTTKIFLNTEILVWSHYYTS